MMASWVDQDHAMELTSGRLTLTVRELADGLVSVVLTADDAVLHEPKVHVGDGRIVVDCEATRVVAPVVG